jgi:hypothetical protein
MVDGLAITLIVVALLVAGFGGIMAILDRPPRLVQLAGLAIVEVVLVVQAAVAMAKVFTGDRPDQLATFIGYLLTAILIPPLAALVGWSERTRWGSTIVAIAGAIVAVMVVRLQQVWSG